MMGEIGYERLAGRRVLVTGHTGFKGAWLSLWLRRMHASVIGLALDPPTQPNLYEAVRLGDEVLSLRADIRRYKKVLEVVEAHAPEVVFHLAAQPLVRRSYADPLETYGTNLMGTVHLLEACRQVPGIRVVVVVTSDKCYEAREGAPCREGDPLGGHDPYSSSKACTELAAAAYRRSYFETSGEPLLATVRAGNVIGGGDWAADRLIPDCLRAFERGKPVAVRYPAAVRPWQHVLDPLCGYLRLADRLLGDGREYTGAWNFAPEASASCTVEEMVASFIRLWGWGEMAVERSPQPHETGELLLDSSKAREKLGWRPLWSLETTLEKTVEWYKAHAAGEDMQAFTLSQIAAYEEESLACESR